VKSTSSPQSFRTRSEEINHVPLTLKRGGSVVLVVVVDVVVVVLVVVVVARIVVVVVVGMVVVVVLVVARIVVVVVATTGGRHTVRPSSLQRRRICFLQARRRWLVEITQSMTSSLH
jgi:hypothetical protein